MHEMQLLLDLPFETLVVLAGGYLSYRLAYTGKDASHTSVDVVFLTVVFGALARLTMSFAAVLLPSGQLFAMIAPILGVFLALSGAAFWRRCGEAWASRMFRWLKVSHSDRYRTAWEVISTNAGLHPTQLMVRRKDGGLLMCENLSRFSNEKVNPCIYGSDGSIALFVTHQMPPDKVDLEEIEVHAEGWGSLITYIPASEIAGIYARH